MGTLPVPVWRDLALPVCVMGPPAERGIEVEREVRALQALCAIAIARHTLQIARLQEKRHG